MINNTRSRQMVQRDITIGTHQAGISGRFPIPRNGIIGEWLLNGNALDTSGSGNNGTATNITYTGTEVSYQSQTAVGNGTNARITTAFAPNTSTDFTISLWCNFSSLKSGINNEGTLCGTRSFPNGFYMGSNESTGTNPTKFFLAYATTNGLGTTTLVTGKWYHVILVCSGNTQKIYLDNILEISTSATANTSGVSMQIFDTTTLGRYFPGNIQLFRYYNRALSSKEIYTLYIEGLKLLH